MAAYQTVTLYLAVIFQNPKFFPLVSTILTSIERLWSPFADSQRPVGVLYRFLKHPALSSQLVIPRR